MTGIFEDLRFGLRALAKNRSFTAAAVLSLMLGTGATTTIFTLVYAVLMRPLPVTDAARLVAVHTTDARNPGYLGVSFPNYQEYRDHNQVFSSLLLYTGVALNLTGSAEPRLVMGQICTANCFSTLGVKPVVGRAFQPEEDVSPGAYAVAVISYRLWQREFAGDPNVTSRTLSLNGRSYRIVGVAPVGFEGIDTLTATDVWLPLMMYPQVYGAASQVNNRRALLFSAVGRLRPGIGMAQAEASLRALAHDLEQRFPKENRGRDVALTALAESALPHASRGSITQAGRVLVMVSVLVLLIACGNVASLLLARAASRHKEIAVRLALGAGRARLIRQLLTESILLALVGGLAGLVFAAFARNVLWSMRPPMFTYSAVHLDLDRTVLAFSLGISLLTGILFGLAPALRATRSDLSVDLKERAGQSSSRWGRWNPRSVLVMGQVAFSVIALVGAGLFVRSVSQAGRFDPGFDAAHLGVVVFNVADQGYSEARGREFRARVLQRASEVPGVAAAGLAKDWPFFVSFARNIMLEGQENTSSGTGRRILEGVVAPGFLRAAGIPLLRGRDFGPQDSATNPHTAIVNEVAANAYWPGEDPVGKRVTFAGEAQPVEVIGVARNANYLALGERPQAFVYVSMDQYYYPGVTLYIRAARNPDAVLAAVHREVQALDHNLLLQSQSIDTIIRHSLWQQQLSAGLLSLFGALALLLAGVGIYGVVAYAVAQRSREFGLRMALGATAGEVQMMLVREGIRLVAIGVVIGLAVALWASRWVASMLFETDSRDAATFVAAPAILGLVAILACWLPARRTTRIDPATALREE